MSFYFYLFVFWLVLRILVGLGKFGFRCGFDVLCGGWLCGGLFWFDGWWYVWVWLFLVWMSWSLGWNCFWFCCGYGFCVVCGIWFVLVVVLLFFFSVCCGCDCGVDYVELGCFVFYWCDGCGFVGYVLWFCFWRFRFLYWWFYRGLWFLIVYSWCWCVGCVVVYGFCDIIWCVWFWCC